MRGIKSLLRHRCGTDRAVDIQIGRDWPWDWGHDRNAHDANCASPRWNTPATSIRAAE